jgi:imidazolonepropionase
VVEAGRVAWCGREADLPAAFAADPRRVDLGGRVVTPGWVECHTHVVYAGDRTADFERRVRGLSYEQIARLGGGIQTTVDATRAAGIERLVELALPRLGALARHGATTVEIKSGYGLDAATELALLEVVRRLQGLTPLTLVPTFLGAHVVPREHRADRERYVRLLTDELLPEVAARGLAEFCDVFCEEGAFTLAEARRILLRAAGLGLKLKLHAEQLSHTGATALAVELGATSADHLEAIDDADVALLAASRTVPVLLPGATLFLGKSDWAPGRRLADAGALPALSTDLNPGSSPTAHLPLMTTLGCTRLGLTPAEALLGVTRRAAAALAREDRAGVLAPGRDADLCVMDVTSHAQIPYELGRNPVERVMVRGEWIV